MRGQRLKEAGQNTEVDLFIITINNTKSRVTNSRFTAIEIGLWLCKIMIAG